MRKILQHLSGFSLVMMVVLVIYDASMRYLFSAGSTALQELQWHFFDAVILLSIAYTLQHNAHVRVDIFYDRFSPRTKQLIDIITLVFFIIPFSLFIIYTSYDFVLLSFTQNEASSDPGGLPYRWIVKSLIIIAFVGVIFEAATQLYTKGKQWLR